MAFTQSQLDALKAAYASGLLSVEYNGRHSTYRSQADMAQAIARMEAELSPATVRPRSSLAEFDPR